MIATLLATAAHLPAEAEGASAEHAEAAGLPQMDVTTYVGQVFWLLVTFGLLYALLAKVFLPRLGAVLEERRGRIADDLDTAANLRGDAEDAGRAMESAMADARARAHAIVAKQRDALNAEIDAEAKEADAALDLRLADSATRIETRKTAALAQVREVGAEAATALVQKLIGVTPDQAEVARALDAAAGGQGR